MGPKFLQIYDSLQTCLIKRFTAHNPITAWRYYSQFHTGQKGDGDRAPHNQGKEGHKDRGPAERAASTAEEFRRVAEEKTREASASQTTEKAVDGFQETTTGDSSVKSVEESFKEPPGKGNFNKTGDERNPLEK
ncbi:hypothetical protein ACH5RR_027853 [Cinchona calisaya]|uniref:Uncharacterized protein n=1 Tax=Cinchona calisaya TaxID=153742 RepID=A0ABD2YM34_9GENT